MRGKMIFTAIMAAFCLTATAQGERKAPCDTAKCCGQMPIPGLNLTEENATQFKEIFGRYMDEIKKVRESMAEKCGISADEKTQPAEGEQGGRPEGGKPGKELSDDEMETLIKAEISAERDILDIKEKYYDEFRAILTPAQIHIVYSQQSNGQRQPGGMQRGGGRPEGGPQGGPGMGQRPQMPR